MKKRIQLLLLSLSILMLTGCGYKETITIKKDGKSSTNVLFYASTEEATSTGAIGTEVINKKKYYKFKTAPSATDPKKYESIYYDNDGVKMTTTVEPVHSRSTTQIKADKFMYVYKEAASSIDFYELTVKMPKKIVATNGKLSADKKSVTFDVKDYKIGEKLYAYTSADAAKKDGVSYIQLKGLNSNGHLTSAKKLRIVTGDRIKSITVNDKKQTSKEIKIKKEGKYTVKVVTDAGSQTFKFYYDKTKPTTNIKSKEYSKKVKITYSDNGSGIKKATLDGSNIKSGKTCKKKGNHTLVLIDKAGNKRTVKFTIKK